MPIDSKSVEAYVKSIDLTGIPRRILSQDAATEAGEVFDKAKTQAQVVGSGLFSFTQGVDTEVRQAISDCALLAQLVANKKFNLPGSSPFDWFGAYTDVLNNLGWTSQDMGWSDYTAVGKAAEVNAKIIEVLELALGQGAAAVAIITSVLNTLQGMNPSSSWITIFNRESQKAEIARFQIGLVDQAPNTDVFVSMIAFVVQAHSAITQALFFKYRDAKATFKANLQKVSMNRPVLTPLIPIIESRIRDYTTDYVSKIANIVLPAKAGQPA
jgi:hypothetical protein